MKKLILIADDDAKHRKLLSDVLQASGYDTLTATNGARAVEMARSHKPDLILMDAQMPVMDGCAAVNVLKADHVTRSIPAIAITALAMDGDRERMFEAGFDGYLGKPISIKDLRSVVASHLDHEIKGRERP
jgi:CheY-like chemotaxis protein